MLWNGWPPTNKNKWEKKKWRESCSVVSDSLWPHGLHGPRNSPGQNTGVGGQSLLQGIFPTQWSNPGLPHCRRILYNKMELGKLSPLSVAEFPHLWNWDDNKTSLMVLLWLNKSIRKVLHESTQMLAKVGITIVLLILTVVTSMPALHCSVWRNIRFGLLPGWISKRFSKFFILAALGPHHCLQAFSSCSGQRLPLLWRPRPSLGAQALGISSCGVGLSCPMAGGLFPDQGSNLCPLHWQNSWPLGPQESPPQPLLLGKLVIYSGIQEGNPCPSLGSGLTPESTGGTQKQAGDPRGGGSLPSQEPAKAGPVALSVPVESARLPFSVESSRKRVFLRELRGKDDESFSLNLRLL